LTPTPSGERWLIVRGGALGDFILTVPVIRAIRARAAHVTLVATPRYAALWPDLYDVVIDGRSTQALWLHGSGRPTALPDVAVVFTPGVAHHLRRLGAAHVRDVAPHAPQGTHTGTHLWSAVADWASGDPTPPTVHPDPECLARLGHQLTGPTPIVLAPGAGSPEKRWPHMLELAHSLIDSGTPVVWVPGRDERRLSKPPAPALDLGLPGLVALASRCRAWVGNDTGTTHLAAAAGANTFALFGPSDPNQWAPKKAEIVPFKTTVEALMRHLIGGQAAAE